MKTNLLKQLRQKSETRLKRCSECHEDVENTYQSSNGDVICPRCYIALMSSITEQD